MKVESTYHIIFIFPFCRFHVDSVYFDRRNRTRYYRKALLHHSPYYHKVVNLFGYTLISLVPRPQSQIF